MIGLVSLRPLQLKMTVPPAGVQDSLIRKNWQGTVILPLEFFRYLGSAAFLLNCYFFFAHFS